VAPRHPHLPRARLRGAVGLLVPSAHGARLRGAARRAARAARGSRHLRRAEARVKAGQCPGCGAPVEFAAGAGKVKVCEHCSTVVLRGEASLESLGKVAELVDTDSPLKVGLGGRVGGIGFRIAGRIQKSHGHGTWDEWCLALDDGRTAWLSESEGAWN